MAMLCVLAMFLPAFFMVGAAKAMFLPLSLAVGFSMVASYLLSSTLVPILSVWALRKMHERRWMVAVGPDWFCQVAAALCRRCARLLVARWLVVAVYLASPPASLLVYIRAWGRRSSPGRGGPTQVRLRAPAGTQIDGTEAYTLQALELIKQEAGAERCAHAGLHRRAWSRISGQFHIPVEQRAAGRRAAGPIEERLTDPH